MIRTGVAMTSIVAALAAGAGPAAAQSLPPAPNGKIGYSQSGDVWTANPDGSSATRVTHTPEAERAVAFSPDGTRVAFVRTMQAPNSSTDEIFVIELATGAQTRITFDPQAQQAVDDQPTWSPDGTRLAWASLKDGDMDIYVANADGTGRANFTGTTGNEYSPTWSPDGDWIAYSAGADKSIKKLGIVGLTPSGNAETIVTGPTAMPTGPAWSPDGTAIAYADYGTPSVRDLFTVAASGGSGTNITNSAATDEGDPVWSPDGTLLLFRSGVGLATIQPDGSNTNVVPGVSGGFDLQPGWGRLLCGGRALTSWGTDGDDTLVGTAGNDVIAGLAGRDVITPGAGADLICGGAGGDQVSYADHLQAVEADLWQTDLADHTGDIGDDGSAADGPLGARDTILPDVESILGSPFDDLLGGNVRANFLDGGAGNDTLNSLAGNDVLVGGPGDDSLDGWLGIDAFFGGPGVDTIAADDGVADLRIDCGAGIDPAPAVDAFDPAPLHCP